MYNSKKIVKKAAGIPRQPRTKGFTQVHEILNVAKTGAQLAAGFQVQIQPSILILTARRTGFIALYDECRLDSLVIKLFPQGGSAALGTYTVYIERDPAAAIVATQLLASDQYEQRTSRLNLDQSIRWHPQQPSDYAFQPILAGTISVGSFNVIGTAAIDVQMTLVSHWTFRGRP